MPWRLPPRAFLLLGVGALLGAAALFLFGVRPWPGAPPVQAATINLNAGDQWFCAPGNISCQVTDFNDIDVVTSINAGDSITWTNVGGLPHSINECTSNAFNNCASTLQVVNCPWPAVSLVNSLAMNPNQSFTCAFSTPGTFFYRCGIHPSTMRGQVNVQGADADGDGLPDSVETATGTNPNDDDTDDDGLMDGSASSEDLNNDGDVDAGETDPRDADSDDDGLPDGLERGLTAPEGDDTNLGAGNFIADQDPATTTNPRDADSDDDGLSDGQEDANHNGRVDAGETNPNDSDTDNDGVNDSQDDLPLDPTETVDTDSDGIGDNADADDDNDGTNDDDEANNLGTHPKKACGGTGVPYPENPSFLWSPNYPLDLRYEGMWANSVNIVDLSSFIAPARRHNTSPEDVGFNVRWDLRRGALVQGGKVINISDLSEVVIQKPPMYTNGLRAYGNPQLCPGVP